MSERFERAPQPPAVNATGEPEKIERPEEQLHKEGQKAPEDLENTLQDPAETEREQILDQLLTRVPNEEEHSTIAYIIRNSEFLSADTEYSSYWERALYRNNDEERAEQVSEIFKEKLVDKTMIDLGGSTENMRQILCDNGLRPKLYINIDKFQFNNDNSLTRITPQGFQYGVSSMVWRREKDINRVEINADMLDFLQYVEDNSVDAVALNGIDSFVIQGKDYHEELGRQIQRILKVDGILFGHDSRAIELLIRDKNFSDKWERKWTDGNNNDVQILEKKEKNKE